MKHRVIAFGVLSCLIAGVACNSGSGANPDISCDPLGCISLNKFSTDIFNALNGKVVGFAEMVGGAFPLTGGLARTNADPPSYAMSIQAPINIASSTKILTTIGVLQSLDRNHLTLADKISPYLWPDWPKGPNVDTISFQDLLTHHAGFRDDCGGDQTTYADIKQQIRVGVTLADKSSAVYNNCNFAIFRELLPFMEGHHYSGPESGRAEWSAEYYINYMNQNVFGPIGIGNHSCTPDPNNIALSYPFPAGSIHGDNWGDWKLSCGGGGWVMSASDLFAVINDLATGSVLLTTTDKSQMNSHCLGWDCSVRNDCPYPPYACKNGDLPAGDIWVWTYVGIFQCNVPVVVVVNSPLPPAYQNGEDIIGLVKDAYLGAIVPGTPKPCSTAPPPAPLRPVVSAPTPVAQPNTSATPEATATILPLQPFAPLSPQPFPTVQPAKTATPIVARPFIPLVPEVNPTPTRTTAPRDDSAPHPPVLVSPINGIGVDCATAKLTWRAAQDPSGIRDYDVQLEKLVDRNFVSARTWNNQKALAVEFDPACGTTFRWRARATDNAGNQGTWSDFAEFAVRPSIR